MHLILHLIILMIIIIMFPIFRYPVSNMTISASTWFACVVVIDRVAAIKNWKIYFNLIKEKEQQIISIIIILSFILHLPRFLDYFPDHEEIQKMMSDPLVKGADLGPLGEHDQYRIITFFVNGILISLIPLTINGFFGSFLIVNFIYLKRSRLQFSASQISRSSRNKDNNIALATKLAIVSSCLFVTTGVFSFVVTISAMINPKIILQGHLNPFMLIISDVATFLIVGRISVLFLLYCLSCRQYRKALGRLFSSQPQ